LTFFEFKHFSNIDFSNLNKRKNKQKEKKIKQKTEKEKKKKREKRKEKRKTLNGPGPIPDQGVRQPASAPTWSVYRTGRNSRPEQRGSY
jgi:hypothetical protein